MEKGRKPGSPNKLNKRSKEELVKFLNDPKNDMNKLIKHIPMEDRFNHMKHLYKILVRGNDLFATSMRDMLYEQLKGEFKRFPNYYYLLPLDKRATELRQLLKMLPPDKIEEVLSNLGRGK